MHLLFLLLPADGLPLTIYDVTVTLSTSELRGISDIQLGYLEEPDTGKWGAPVTVILQVNFCGLGFSPNPQKFQKIWLAYFPKVCTAPASISAATCSGVEVPAYSLATASLRMPPIAEGIY